MSVETRVAIVTGGAQGIGRGIVRHLLSLQSARWCVGIVDRDEAGIANAQTFFADAVAQKRLLFVRGDVGKKATAVDVVAQTVKAFDRLDLLVNNAGGAKLGVDVLEVTEEEWSAVLDGNLSSAFFFAQAAALHLAKTNGSIVNICSTRALMSEPNCEAYAAAKGGVVALTHALAASLAPKGINVNAVAPGWIDVSGPEWGAGREQAAVSEADRAQHWAGRVGTPDDVAEAVMYLHGARFVCGQVLPVCGGMTKKMIYREDE